MTPKFYVATSRATINKPAYDDKATMEALASGWINQELSITDLADHINQGYPFTVHHDGRRKGENFIQTNTVPVDVDDGKLADTLALPFVQEYAAIAYTTASHTPEHNRFRIIFRTARMITTSDEMRAAYTGIIRMFGGDGSCKDACRMWYGSKDCNPILLDNTLPDEALDKIIALGKEDVVRNVASTEDGKKTYRVLTGRANIQLEPNQIVQLAKGGTSALLASLSAKTPIHCPVHLDRRPSAMVTRNAHGINGVYCSTCALTYWPKGTSFTRKRKPFDFGAITRAVKEMATEQDISDDLTNIDDDGNLIWPTTEETAAWHAEMDARTCVTTYSKYVTTLPFKEGVTMLQSPKGSGKTEWLKQQVAECKAKGLRVLLIGHRQTLLKSMSERVGLDCYFYLDNGKLKNNPPSDYYAICLDSMTKLLRPETDQYDVIIIDESEQVFAHLTQDTLAEKRRHTVTMLFHYLDAAKAVLYCDADLGSITVEAAYQAASADMPVRFVVNEFKARGEAIDLYDSEHHLIAEVLKAVEAGGTHYVATNSREKAKHLQELVITKFPDLNTRLVTSEQATDPETQDFIADIKTEVLNYGLVIASPSLGTGVDITFDGNEQKIDTVFGFFYSGVNTHFDIDQQLCRVRHPKAIKVWISPKRFNFETEPEAIATELIASREANDAIIGYTRTGQEIVDTKYIAIYAHVTAIKRVSLNDLQGNFVRYRESQGWTVRVVDKDSEAAKEAGKLARAAKSKVREQERADVAAAAPLSSAQYETLQDRQKSQKLSKNELDSMRNYEAESFYCQPVSEDLLLLDNGGRYRDKVRLAELVFAEYSEVLDTSNHETLREDERKTFTSDVKNTALKRKVMRDLLVAAGLSDGWNAIKPEALVNQDDLTAFASAMVENRGKLEHLFGISVRGDLHNKAISSVQQVLGLIGLEFNEVKTQKDGARKIRYYQICPDSLAVLKEVIEQRALTRPKKSGSALPMRKRTKLLGWDETKQV